VLWYGEKTKVEPTKITLLFQKAEYSLTSGSTSVVMPEKLIQLTVEDYVKGDSHDASHSVMANLSEGLMKADFCPFHFFHRRTVRKKNMSRGAFLATHQRRSVQASPQIHSCVRVGWLQIVFCVRI